MTIKRWLGAQASNNAGPGISPEEQAEIVANAAARHAQNTDTQGKDSAGNAIVFEGLRAKGDANEQAIQAKVDQSAYDADKGLQAQTDSDQNTAIAAKLDQTAYDADKSAQQQTDTDQTDAIAAEAVRNNNQDTQIQQNATDLSNLQQQVSALDVGEARGLFDPVADLAGVSATEAAAEQDKYMIFVEDDGNGVGAIYNYDHQSTAAVTGDTVLATHDGEGRWIKVPNMGIDGTSYDTVSAVDRANDYDLVFSDSSGKLSSRTVTIAKLAGPDGKSAYQAWLDQGNTGTEQEFIQAITGDDGEDGDDVTATVNADGKSVDIFSNGVFVRTISPPEVVGFIEGEASRATVFSMPPNAWQTIPLTENSQLPANMALVGGGIQVNFNSSTGAVFGSFDFAPGGRGSYRAVGIAQFRDGNQIAHHAENQVPVIDGHSPHPSGYDRVPDIQAGDIFYLQGRHDSHNGGLIETPINHNVEPDNSGDLQDNKIRLRIVSNVANVTEGLGEGGEFFTQPDTPASPLGFDDRPVLARPANGKMEFDDGVLQLSRSITRDHVVPAGSGAISIDGILSPGKNITVQPGGTWVNLGTGEAATPVSIGTQPNNTHTANYSVAGAVQPEGFTAVVSLVEAASEIRLIASTDPTFATSLFAGPMVATESKTLYGLDAVHVAKLAISRLPASALIYYYIEADGSKLTSTAGQLQLPQFRAQPQDFKVLMGSCQDSNTDPEVYTNPFVQDADLFVHMGDLHYLNLASGSASLARRETHNSLSKGNIQSLLRNMPMAYMYDDHDAGPNDNHMGQADFAAINAASREAYFDLFPHYPLAQPVGTGWGQGLAQQWDWARVRFVMPDLRYQRQFTSLNTAPATTMGTGLNTLLETWNQLQWFFGQLLLAKQQGQLLLVFLSSCEWGNKDDSNHTWGHLFSAERQRIGEFVADNDVPEILIVHGDGHTSFFDDGTTTDVSNGKGQIPHIMSSGLNKEGSADFPQTNNSWRGLPNGLNAKYSILALEFTDNGDRIRWDGKFYNRTTQGLAPYIEASNYDTPIAMAFDSATYSAVNNVATITLERNWFGACSVDYSSSNTSDNGTVEFGPHQYRKTFDIDMTGVNATTLNLSNPAGGVLGTTVVAIVSNN